MPSLPGLAGLLGLLAAAASVLPLGAPSSAPAVGGEGPRHFTVGVLDGDATLDPSVAAASDLAREVRRVHFGTLTDLTADDLSVVPGLAEAWVPSRDGRTFTYTLREGLTWSDGTPLTASDVATTIRRAREERWPDYYDAVAHLDARATFPRTLVVTTTEPDPRLPALDVPVVPAHTADAAADSDAGADGAVPPGAGPFVVQAHDAQRWQLTANRSSWAWHGGEPTADTIEFRVFPDGEALAGALRSGDIDFAHDVPPATFGSLEGIEQITPVTGTRGDLVELAMNTSRGILGDPSVRAAVARAIDREQLVADLARGFGSPDTAPRVSVAPRFGLRDPDEPAPDDPDADARHRYDPRRAAAVIAAAGADDAPLELVVAEDSLVAGAGAEEIIGWLHEAGLDARAVTAGEGDLERRVADGDYDLLVLDRSVGVEPGPALARFTCGRIDAGEAAGTVNVARWCDARYDTLYAEQQASLDPEAREDVVRAMLRILDREVPSTVLLAPDTLQAFRSDRWKPLERQPSDAGTVLFTPTSPAWTSLEPAVQFGPGRGKTLVLLAVSGFVGAVALAALAAGLLWLHRRADRTPAPAS